MDKKKIHPTGPQWDSNAEQEIFGNQSPFAADSSSSNNSNNTLPPPPPPQQQEEQYPHAGSSSSNNNHVPAASPRDQPFIFPHYPTQQPYHSPFSHQPPPNNKGAFRDVQVPEDAPPMYTKEPTTIVPPPTPLSIPPLNATAPLSPSSATASAPPSAHPYPQPQVQPQPPQESLPRVLPVQTRQAPYHHPQSPVLHQPSIPPTKISPISPQVNSPTAPTSPRQDRPPPPHTTPASYGAIRPPHPQGHSRSPQSSRLRTPPLTGNSGSESDSSSEDEEERIAARERRRRRKAIKKHLSGCTCNKICWFLIFLVLLSFWTSPIEKTIKDPCTLMAERRLEPELSVYSIGKPSHKIISLDIMEHILGDITVVEADSWVQDWISVNVYQTFSHPDVNDVVNFNLKFDSSYNIVTMRADLNSTDPTEREKEAKIMKNHCARIDVELVFPKYSDNVKRLFARTQKGDIRIRTEGTTMIFKELHLETLVGDVLFEAGTVQTSTTIATGRGKVQGTIRTLEKIEVSTAMGDIALVVDARPGLHGSDNDKFNITLQSVKSSIDLGLRERYTGLFSLESGIDRPTFGLSPNYTDTVRINKSLPSVSATARNGLVHVQVLDKPKRTK